jgi:precorrin-2/cobalt-factor-2 C20-methyltransferase
MGHSSIGQVICVGLGPGDPELMSVKAHRLVTSATQVAHFRKAGRPGQARRIVESLLRPDVTEYPMEYPVTTELAFDSPEYDAALSTFYDHWADRLRRLSTTGDVIVLCEGDPFFYGSFMHLYNRLRGLVEVEVIPGITGMSGCWTATGQPITWGDDVLSVLMATLPEADLTRQIAAADAVVIMKTGRNLPRIRAALAAAGRLEQAWIVEQGTMPGQAVTRLTDYAPDTCGYFSIVLVHGNGRRPGGVQ